MILITLYKIIFVYIRLFFDIKIYKCGYPDLQFFSELLDSLSKSIFSYPHSYPHRIHIMWITIFIFYCFAKIFITYCLIIKNIVIWDDEKGSFVILRRKTKFDLHRTHLYILTLCQNTKMKFKKFTYCFTIIFFDYILSCKNIKNAT